MNYDRDKVDEMVLALLCLAITEESDQGARTSGHVKKCKSLKRYFQN